YITYFKGCLHQKNKDEASRVHRMIRIGPVMPITTPPSRNSFCSTIPVLYTMALGGVETGNSRAHEAHNPITRGKIAGLTPEFKLENEIATGIKIVVAAVLLMKFEIPTEIRLNRTRST